MSRFILIHSTGESPRCWQRLSTALESYGHRTHPIDLPVDRPELLADDYASIMCEQVGHIAEPIVLAHSGSGTLPPSGFNGAQSTTSSLACRLGAKPPRQFHRRGARQPERA